MEQLSVIQLALALAQVVSWKASSSAEMTADE
jgi:hypothetical protein